MRKLCDQYPGERALITEAYVTYKQQTAYYGTPQAPEAQLPFNFHLISADWSATSVAKVVEEYEASLPSYGWPNWVLSNHDKHRLGTRLPQGQARIAAMVLLTLRGTPTLYYADELGAKDVVVPPELAQDPVELKTPGKGFGRDPERAPMLWDATANAGFTTGAPWLPLEPDYVTLNVEAQDSDSQSMLSLYKTLLKLRRATPALNVGSYKQVAATDEVLAFIREVEGQKFFVALNFTDKTSKLTLGDLVGHVAFTSMMDQVGQSVAGNLELRPNEGVVVNLD
jgi:alpha-glucosidase